MFEYTCPTCGKIHRVAYKSQVQTYCNKSCAVKGRYMKLEEEETEDYYREPQDGDCVFHPVGVCCTDRRCMNCGWNPVVARARLAAYKEKHDETTVE